jgi:hypothetical protein
MTKYGKDATYVGVAWRFGAMKLAVAKSDRNLEDFENLLPESCNK